MMTTQRTREFQRGIAIGLNYTGSLRLQNCVSDATCMTRLMQENLHIPAENVKTITDLPGNPFPTKTVIYGQMKNLFRTSDGSAVIASMSSHGFNMSDTNGDEIDRRDEAVLCAGGTSIKDDDVYAALSVQGPDCCIVVVVDACHSGTIVDLPYQFDGTNWNTASRRRVAPRAFVVGISGARDSETASDGAGSNGAFTAAFLRVIREHGATLTYAQMYAELYAEVSQSGQLPVITSSRVIPPNAMFMSGGKLVLY